MMVIVHTVRIGVIGVGVEGGVTPFTSCATFPQSALRKSSATGKVRHATLNKTSASWKALTRLSQSYWGSTPDRPQVVRPQVVNSAAIG